MDTTNLVRHDFYVSRPEKENKFQTKGAVFWLSGLSGSGKSTIANELEKILFDLNFHTKILDGDSVRTGLCSDLAFSQKDRTENLRRVAEVAKLFSENSTVVICCFITPLESQRDYISKIIGSDFNLVFIDASLKECQRRDPKGLYKKAREGIIKNFTGIDSTFEPPKDFTLKISTEEITVMDSARKIADLYLRSIQK